jgi:hypothetical protein
MHTNRHAQPPYSRLRQKLSPAARQCNQTERLCLARLCNAKLFFALADSLSSPTMMRTINGRHSQQATRLTD